MGVLEIILLAVGAAIFIGSFCIPVKEEKLREETKNLAAEEVKELVSKELESVRDRLTELSEEEMRQQIEKSERSMERISNEKIMAVNEYSDTVLEEIHKNHEEVVFLYDMLKNKKESLSEYYDKADRNLQDLLQELKDSEITLRENMREIALKQKELEAVKAEAQTASRRAVEIPVYGMAAEAAPEKKTAVSSRRTKKAEQQESAKGQELVSGEGADRAADAVEPAGKVQTETQTESDFKPFVPERVEVTPKKPRAKKTVKKPAEKAVPKPEAESPEVMLLLADGAENGAGENSNERILELHKAGKSNMAIARELGLGVGEVKLVIDLYEGIQ